jgi:uncharacterized membrane protein required for colicin V production
MSNFDLTMFILVASASLWGAYHGLVRQATTLGAWAVGIIAAALLRQPVAELIGGTEPANQIGAAIIVLFATSLLVHIVGNAVRQWIADARLEGFDRQMGLLLGAVKGIAVAIVVTIAGYHLHEPSRDAIVQSHTAQHVARIVEQVEPLVPPPAQQWLSAQAKQPLKDIRENASPTKKERRLFVASLPTANAVR